MKRLRALSDRTPLHVKLITAVLSLVILALIAISLATTVMLRSYLITQHDPTLQASFPPSLRPGVVLGKAYPFNGGITGFQEPGHQLSWAEDGNMPVSGNAYQSLPGLPTGGWADGGQPTLTTVSSRSGDGAWRVIAQSMTMPVTTDGSTQNQTVNVVVAVYLGDVDAATHRLQLFDLAVGGAIVVVLAIIAVAVVQANLRPLNDIEMTAGQIAKGHLNHRVPELDPRTEIGSLGRSLNAMLAQIESAFHDREKSERAAQASEERMRRFIADASHELRTPLTTIRGFAEYYRQRGGVTEPPASSRTDHPESPADSGSLTPADIDRIMSRLESEASRMGLLVEDLLQLARMDQHRPLDLGPVDLLTLAADAVQDSRMVAPDRPVELIIGKGAFITDGDEQRLRQVIGNLVNNARTHTPPGTPVRVRLDSGTLEDGSPAVVLDVEDDGPGMTAEQCKRVFERFYRADAARNRASGGTGLGLAIVAGIVHAHGGSVSVKSAPGDGADFQVRLPLSPDAQGDDPDDPEA
ncbi:MAG: HAMP domain-containing histidine kinase [Streptosporangiales bacterium]|nr:HAMP domain-containing histidine kinase [Streptosporangiales bacterium]